MSSTKSIRKFAVAIVASVILSIAALPAFACDQPAACTYGYVYIRNAKTLVITTRCKTWWEYNTEKLAAAGRAAVGAAQRGYSNGVDKTVNTIAKDVSPRIANSTAAQACRNSGQCK
jgi:hypothetical protein